jgi:hypothetical protein
MIQKAATMDHSEFMVLALQLDDAYQISILSVASKQALAGERLARVCPQLGCQRNVLCCRVSPRQARPFCFGKRPQNH